MKQKIMAVLFAIVLMVAANDICIAQNGWKVGDKVEIPNLSKEWVPGTIIGVLDESGKVYYRVQLDDANAPNVYFNHTLAGDIRARGGQSPNRPPVGRGELMPTRGTLKVGDMVDTFYDQNRGHNRGMIIQVGDRKYKVHYTGCSKTWDEWVDASLVQPPATISAGAPEIKYLFGRWRLTEVAVGGNFVAWGKAPGLQINPDGSYIWYQGAGKLPVKGNWATDAKVPKLNEGTPKFDGVIIKDDVGQEWKAFRWVVKGDTKDHIEIDRMCLGITQVGSRF
jgi:hypothetical protein